MVYGPVYFTDRVPSMLNSFDNKLQQYFPISSYSLFNDLLQSLPISFQVHVIHRLSYVLFISVI